MSSQIENKDLKKKRKPLKIVGWLLLTLVLLVFLLLLFIRSPWGQNIIVNKAITYISEKTTTKVEIQRLFITFSGNAYIEGLYLEDKKGDTLLYSHSLEASVALAPLIKGDKIKVNSIDWDGVVANINRTEKSGTYNFDFLIDAFATDSTPSDTTSSSMPKLEIGPIALKDFKIAYLDEVDGLDAFLELGELHLKMNELDLDLMKFHITRAAISNTQISYTQNKTIGSNPESSEASVMPVIIVDRFTIENTEANYTSISDRVEGKFKIGSFLLALPEANMGKKKITLQQLQLANSQVYYSDLKEEKILPIDTTSIKDPINFEWPGWEIETGLISLENNIITYISKDYNPTNGTYSTSTLELNKLELAIPKALLANDTAEISLTHLSFYEKNGFLLNHLGFNIKADNEGISLTDLNAATQKSNLNGEVKIEYGSIDSFLNHPESSIISMAMPSFNLSLEELYTFQPSLKENIQFQNMSKKEVSGKVFVEGTLEKLQVKNSALQWGNSTTLQLEGVLSNMMQTDSLYVDIPNLNFTTVKPDMAHFLNEEELGISLPDSMQLNATLLGTLTNLEGEVKLDSPDGNILLTGNFTNRDKIIFDADVEVVQLQLQKLLNNEQLSPVSFTLRTSGSGNSLNTMDAKLDSDFTDLKYQGYDFSKIDLNGEVKNGEGAISLKFKDDNLNIQMHAGLVLDSISPQVDMILNVVGADLSSLGVTQNDIKVKFQLQANFKGNAQDFTLRSQLTDALVVFENTPYPVENLIFNAAINEKGTSADIHSKLVQGDFLSNTDISSLNQALIRHFKNYFLESTAIEQSETPVTLKMKLTMKQAPLLEDVFLGGLKKIDSVNLQIDFNEAEQNLTANFRAPFIDYAGSTLDSLRLDLKGTAQNLDFEFGWKAINSGPIAIPRTSINGTLENKELQLNFDAYDGKEMLTHVGSKLTARQDTLNIHIQPSGLIISKQSWEIPETNNLAIAEKFIELKDFSFQRNQQKMTVSSNRHSESEQDLSLNFNNFRLGTFTSFLNPDESLLTGILNGDLTFKDPYGDTGMVAKMEIENLTAMQIALGNLSLNANSKSSNTYDFDLSLSGGDVDLAINGDYLAAQSGAQLNLNLLINEIKMKAIQALVSESISDPTGTLAGEFKVNGTLAEPQYQGTLQFNETGFLVNTLNTKFTLADEEIKIDNKGVYFNNFDIADANNNLFNLDGSIFTEQLDNPSFDLKIKAKEFQALNATKEDNDLFYGMMKLDADMEVKGNLAVPKISGTLKIIEGSNLTFVVPESQLEVMEREGVVLFVNKANPDAIITKSNKNSAPSAVLKGFDLNAVLRVDDNSTFTIVIDERSGDNFQVTGEGEFNFGITPTGLTSLAGRYEVSNGHYEASLYNLVKRRFDISPGSTLIWSGDPFNAQVKLRAIYKLETSAAPIMATQTSAASAGIANKYRQKLPFLVYLNVDGVLLKPEISFNLDIPEEEQGALGGEVYGRVQQLNEREEELNKQVFSLLVLNRFFPGSTSDGSSGGAASIARDNVNKVLSGQLNQFSDKLIGSTGVELDFGLDSFTDYQGDTPQERTQLDVSASKRLFNNRLIVQVGSEVDIEGSEQGAESTPVIGNVSIEYLLTENGRFRIKGFRRNEFESVIDGQLIVTGIGLIFNREFNQFKELFAKAVKEEVEKEKK
ncbi:translocation/assembly module TamB domain-containing protein [Arenibacter certesii]|uniref:Translocation and assembly module TamB C-terminal domain-containing protein n=1 Tax=Arenibacter certesii TaxID=228955 RepID=A0A918IPN6_9FLAO|nr:translocation/assembly module TamB domain-containing protein [Arenibacter certesii]GGW24533.1 hypothetical protein GCM10007383_06330 [Arenibacter certesii]